MHHFALRRHPRRREWGVPIKGCFLSSFDCQAESSVSSENLSSRILAITSKGGGGRIVAAIGRERYIVHSKTGEAT
jgi:hypothetical protein